MTDKLDAPLATIETPMTGPLVDLSSLKSGLEQRSKMLQAFREWMGKLLVPGRDYAVIPGTQKPSLLKPGAETLAIAAGARFQENECVFMPGDDGHLEVIYKVDLIQRNGTILGRGVGSCSTMESRYRYRKASRKCPVCGKEAIIKGKAEYGGGWVCFEKKGGCKAKWPDGAPEIESQETGQVENENPADQRNTVLKMAKKRAMVDSVLTAFGLSDFFTQDVEEGVVGPENGSQTEVPPPPPPPRRWKPEGPGYDRLWRVCQAYTMETQGMAGASKISTTKDTVMAVLKDFVQKTFGRPMASEADMDAVYMVVSDEVAKLRGPGPPKEVQATVIQEDLPF